MTPTQVQALAHQRSAEAQAAQKRENAAFEWLPIAAAPVDATVVDLWRPTWCERCIDMRRVDLGNGNVFYEPVSSGPSVVRDASHFMIVTPPRDTP